MSSPSEPLTIETLQSLKGVGPQLVRRLARLELYTVHDLLLHLPLRYQDRTRVIPLDALSAGGEALVEATVAASEVVGARRPRLLVRLEDGSGFLSLCLFHFGSHLQDRLVRGNRIRCFGQVRQGRNGLEMIHPEISPEGQVAEGLTPVYPTTAGLTQATLRRLTAAALARLEELPEWLPPGLRPALTIGEAIRTLHQPPADDQRLLQQARRRLAFEELLAHQLSLRRLRALMRTRPAPRLTGTGLMAGLIGALPFSLTGAQQRVLGEIAADLARPRPMLRLVQGDVGSGKTVVAAAAALLAVGSGAQAAVMAPTELLAEQHYHN
ncbi:MAG: ATP-dependent DNA helicase RecG, partial [Candidatus Competibacteraceae bacterium]|nr:ATP-dependent DNA helicase RecG [Candidatus Competibacteraceae bacterium]